ncbi:MAG: aromatic ring-hydroxylating dioxygenase subunit alpha [Sneathiellaceae bacterium]
MLLRNCWYVAGWSSEIPANTADGLLARTIVNLPVVLWRDTGGAAIAFEDRCCHRGAPLSRGRIEGDALRCMYHGLKFDRAGQCIEIPSQDRVPPQARVRSFPVVERHGWAWIWMGDPALADEALIPDTHWLDDSGWRSLEGYTHYRTSHLLIADNLLDLAHLPYVHPTTLGGDEAYSRFPPRVERIDRGVRITRWATDIAPAGFAQAIMNWPGNVDRWNIYDFVVPGIFLMYSGMQPTGTGAQEGRRVDAVEFRGCQALTPETDDSTHYFFAHPHNFALDRPEVTEAIHANVVKAFAEDHAMIHAQDAMLKLDPEFRMVPIGADQALTQYRRLVAKLAAAEAAQAQAAAAAE